MARISQDVLQAIDGSIYDGAYMTLPRQLDRKLYLQVAKIIELAGGKWHRTAKSHWFKGQFAQDVMEPILLTGGIVDGKKEFGVFYTPAALAERVADAAGIRAGMTVLEPSAGMGALAKAARARGGVVRCLDILPEHVKALRADGFDAHQDDFLKVPDDYYPKFDVVLMNPPFAKLADCYHVMHAIKFLKPGGVLVSIMSAGVTFRQNTICKAVRALADCETEPLPENSFKESGTGINAVLLVYQS